MAKNKLYTLLILLLIGFSISCNKKDQLTENVDPNEVNFLVTQPSIASATFVARCTNYDVILDSVTFLSPNSAIYYQTFNALILAKDEEQMIGGYESVDGLWIMQFKGTIQNSDISYSVSIPYEMNIEADDDE